MKANKISCLVRFAIILMSSAILGTLLLVLVFCIPTKSMKTNIAKSVDLLIKTEEEVGENAIAKYIWGQKETYTDAIMVQNAIENIQDKNVYEHAMWIYHRDLEPEFWNPEGSLKAYCDGEDASLIYLHEYSRYWHGYLVYLKPLLLFFSWSQLIILGAVLQILLMLCVIVISAKKKQAAVGITMVLGFLAMKPVLVLASLTMQVCWLITIVALLYMLFRNDALESKKHYPEFFLLVGILTSYFDFLTYPVVTLGFPLCSYFLINQKNTLKQSIQKIIGYSVSWGIGYAGMWGLKWLIADITLKTGTIKDALWSIIGRTEAIGGRPRMNGGFYVISLNLQEYGWKIYVGLAIVLIVMAFAALLVSCAKTSLKTGLKHLIPFLIIFCIPFAWIIVVQHHSALHARFTFRIIGVAVLALCCMIAETVKIVKKTKNK